MTLSIMKAIALLLCLTSAALADRDVFATLFWTSQDGYTVQAGSLVNSSDTVAWGTYNYAVPETGWAFLEVKTFESFDDNIQVEMQATTARL